MVTVHESPAPLRCAVIGGGIIGVAVARELTRRLPRAEVTILEKESRLAAHQTGHNSGVVHAGLYYEPGGLKATLCRRGVSLLKEFCEQKALPYDECGKLVVARHPAELGRLQAIYERAVANRVPGVRLLTSEEISEVEPHAVGIAALHSPHTAIVDYSAVTRALADDVVAAGGRVRLGCAVSSVSNTAQGVAITTPLGVEHFDVAVVCAGLQSDRVARTSGGARDPRIVPFYGDYYLLEPAHRSTVRGLIYPVPDPEFPFLGVHLTKRIDGETMVGPNAFLSLGREAYARNRMSPRDLLEVLRFAGFWRFAAKNWRAALREIATSVGSGWFRKEAQRFVPDLRGARLLAGPRGVRAQAMDAAGSLVDDFVITADGRTTHIRNAPSPGATSSLAIAEYIIDGLLERSFGEPGTGHGEAIRSAEVDRPGETVTG